MRSIQVLWLAGAIPVILTLCTLMVGCATSPRHADDVARSARVPILMYHHVGDLPPTADRTAKRYTVSTADFAAQMKWLHDHHYHAISTDQLADHLETGAALPHKPVIITFDDGWYDQYVNAFPALKASQLTATFYIYTNGINAGGYISEAQFREMQAAGMRIESHTIGHPSLVKLKPEDAKREIEFPKAEITRRLGTPVTSFAYPFGDFDEKVVAMVREAGYRTAVTTEVGLTQKREQLLYLRRVMMTYGDDLDTFEKVLTQEPGPELKNPRQ